MSAPYNLPLPLSSQNGEDYVIDDGYPHDGGTSPGMGWDGQSDGGGKFRLKRRRRCGQCGPCQVKENCNKCQYCMRKDVLKQACIYRKCIYLRKPVPRFRQEPTTAGPTSNKSAPTPPHKPTPTTASSAPVTAANPGSNSSATNNGRHNIPTPAPNPCVSSPSSVGPPNSNNAELSSCQLNQSPFANLSAMQNLNSGVLDPLRHRMTEQPHRSLFESMNHGSSLDQSRSVLDPSKPAIADMSRFSTGPAPPSLNSHCKLDQAASHTNSLNAGVGPSLSSMNSALANQHSHHQVNKCPPSLSSRDSYFPSMDAWSSMPYALPHATAWATPTLPSHHVAAATYGFQQHSASFPSTFSPSSCQLAMPDHAVSRFVSPAAGQPSFHHSMTMAGFSQDFTHATSNHSSHANIRASMNPPFYHPPPHISPSSIHTFPGLSQFSASQASFAPAAYSMHPHAHMYPSSFYSFRAATEPQIYHVQAYPSQNPFKNSIMQISLNIHGGKCLGKESNSLDFSKSEEKVVGCGMDRHIKNGLQVNPTCLTLTTYCKSDPSVIFSFSTKGHQGEFLNYKSSQKSIMETPQSSSVSKIMKNKHQLIHSSNGKAVLFTDSGKLTKKVSKNCFFGKDHVKEKDKISSVYKHKHHDRSRIDTSLSSGNIDLDLQEHWIWSYSSLECDSFYEENIMFSEALCGRSAELGSDTTDDDPSSHVKVKELQSLDFLLHSSVWMKNESIFEVSKTDMPKSLSPSTILSSPCCLQARYSRNKDWKQSRKQSEEHISIEGSNKYEIMLSEIYLKNPRLNIKSRTRRRYMKKCPCSKLINTYHRKEFILGLRKPHHKPSSRETSSSCPMPTFCQLSLHNQEYPDLLSGDMKITSSSSPSPPLPSHLSPSSSGVSSMESLIPSSCHMPTFTQQIAHQEEYPDMLSDDMKITSSSSSTLHAPSQLLPSSSILSGLSSPPIPDHNH